MSGVLALLNCYHLPIGTRAIDKTTSSLPHSLALHRLDSDSFALPSSIKDGIRVRKKLSK